MLKDRRTAPVPPPLQAALAFLEKLTLAPHDVTPADIEPLREAGLSDEAIEDAIQVCALFNAYDRVADALEFAVPGAEVFASDATTLLARGYR